MIQNKTSQPTHFRSFLKVCLTLLFICLCLLGLLIPVTALSQFNPPTNGLVAWWPGEGNGSDLVAGHNGSLLSGVGFEAGLFGQAFSFQGTGNRVVIDDTPELILTNSL